MVGLNRVWQRSTFGEADGPGAQGNSWGVEVEVEGEVAGDQMGGVWERVVEWLDGVRVHVGSVRDWT